MLIPWCGVPQRRLYAYTYTYIIYIIIVQSGVGVEHIHKFYCVSVRFEWLVDYIILQIIFIIILATQVPRVGTVLVPRILHVHTLLEWYRYRYISMYVYIYIYIYIQ